MSASWFIPVLIAALVLAFTFCAHADRPARKMIPAVTAIDVSSGVEKIQYKASLPWMLTQALVYAGVKTNYAEFCAVSGWSGEFHYGFEKLPVAVLSLDGLASGRCFKRGVECYGKRLELFSQTKPETEEQRLAAARAAWEFIANNIAADRPVLTDYIDGGAFYGYDETAEDPALYFNTNGPGFGALRKSKFLELCGKELTGLGVIADGEPGPDARSLLVATLANLLIAAEEGESDGAPAGLAGMKALAADLLDPAKDWGKGGDWMCWPLSNQTETRLCSAVYLRRNADLLGEEAKAHLLRAADHYERAFESWRQRWQASYMTGDQKNERPAAARMAEPGRREAIAGHVYQALGAELLALSEVRQALGVLKP